MPGPTAHGLLLAVGMVVYAFAGIGESLAFFKSDVHRNAYLTYAHGLIGVLLMWTLFSAATTQALVHLRQPPLAWIFIVYVVAHSGILLVLGRDIDGFKLLQFLGLTAVFLTLLPHGLGCCGVHRIRRLTIGLGCLVASAALAIMFTMNAKASITAGAAYTASPILMAIALLLFRMDSKGILRRTVVVTVLSFTVIASTSRAAILGLVWTVGAFMALTVIQAVKGLLTASGSRGSQLAVLGITGVFGAGVMLALGDTLGNVTIRLETLVDFLQGGSRDTSLLRRQWYVEEFLLHDWSLARFETFFGSGIGTFGRVVGIHDYVYPHNLAIEVFVEFGLCGAVLLGAAICEGLVRAWNSRRWIGTDEACGLCVMLGVTVITALSSGDLCCNRTMFFVLFLCTNVRSMRLLDGPPAIAHGRRASMGEHVFRLGHGRRPGGQPHREAAAFHPLRSRVA